jgi:hypothetical protein
MTRKELPAACVRLGPGAGQSVGVYGHTTAVLGVPTVELAGDLEGLQYLKPETAERLAEALKLAAQLARGEAVPTALDRLLDKSTNHR